ncbi:MAG: DUF4199 domain-containing protein [Bacteroidia bacterium]|jgi:hypothetical protein|nr:DUF4199 domain-containing protein [Bacteroidia bacterium]
MALFLTHKLRPEGALYAILYYLPMIMLLLSIYAATVMKRRENDGYISFKNALQTGFSAAIIVTIFFGLAWFYNVNNSDVHAAIAQKKAGGMTMKEIIDEINATTASSITNRIIMFIIMQLFLGFFISIATSLILRREKQSL